METGENDDKTTGEISSLRRLEYNSDSDFQMEHSTSSLGTAIVVKVALKNRGRDLRSRSDSRSKGVKFDL